MERWGTKVGGAEQGLGVEPGNGRATGDGLNTGKGLQESNTQEWEELGWESPSGQDKGH